MKKLIGLIPLLVASTTFTPSSFANPPTKLDIGTAREIYDGSLYPDKAVRTYQNTNKIFPTRVIKAGGKPSPLPLSDKQLTSLTFTSEGKKYDLPDYVALNRVVGLLVLKDGKIAYEHYDYGLKPDTRWMSMSVAKSFVSTLVGAAIKDGYISSVDDPVVKYLPQLAGSAYQDVSIKDVLMMASGVKWNETYTDPSSDRRKLLELQIASNQKGGIFDILKTLPKASEPGKNFNYSTGETVLIGEIVQAATKMHLADYLSKKVWVPVGMQADAYWWLDSPNGHEVGGSGILAVMRDFARFGQFILNGAEVNGKKIVPDNWLAEATTAKPISGVTGKNGYGYQWWTMKPDAGKVHEQAFMGRGIHGQYLYINQEEKVVVVALSARSKPTGRNTIEDLDFLAAVVEKLRN
ncbi:serine hydrolase domain-containing protein [Herminiimonas arsenitoxidans]|uniref:serine hydrolase domain-containing protein n=1 Tax=Herminiimonas arsenitoxidans TaxID=1809410 RepID=UPI0009703D72|nr:serine hydrolase [Herminiimonas arsenitoxidans]